MEGGAVAGRKLRDEDMCDGASDDCYAHRTDYDWPADARLTRLGLVALIVAVNQYVH
jgi:hypothetical protein